MNPLISAVIGLIPISVISLVVFLMDREKEPLFSYVKCYLLGVFTVCIVLALNKYLLKVDLPSESTLSVVLVYSFLAVALVEELFKFISLLIATKLDKNYNSFYDSIVYSVFIALGFACFENIIYIFSHNLIVRDVIFRTLISVPSHVIFAIFMGKFLELSKTKEKGKVLYLILSLMVPLLLHGLLDFLLLYIPHLISNDVGFYFFIGIFELVLYIMGIKEVATSAKKSDQLLINK